MVSSQLSVKEVENVGRTVAENIGTSCALKQITDDVQLPRLE
jgi:hypothetical protein